MPQYPTSSQLRSAGLRFSWDSAGAADSVREVLRQLLPPEKIVKIAIAGGKVIEDSWKMFELPHNKTGEYQRTIETHIVDAGDDYCEVAVGTSAKQARFLEFGTAKETAQPVMRPAYDFAKGPAQAAMNAEMVKS